MFISLSTSKKCSLVLGEGGRDTRRQRASRERSGSFSAKMTYGHENQAIPLVEVYLYRPPTHDTLARPSSSAVVNVPDWVPTNTVAAKWTLIFSSKGQKKTEINALHKSPVLALLMSSLHKSCAAGSDHTRDETCWQQFAVWQKPDPQMQSCLCRSVLRHGLSRAIVQRPLHGDLRNVVSMPNLASACRRQPARLTSPCRRQRPRWTPLIR